MPPLSYLPGSEIYFRALFLWSLVLGNLFRTLFVWCWHLVMSFRFLLPLVFAS